MSYAIEQVANPEGQYVNQMNKTADLPEVSRMYRTPEFKTMVRQDDRGVPVLVEYSMDFLNPQFDQKKAAKELSEKQAAIRSQKKACGGSLPKKKTNRLKK